MTTPAPVRGALAVASLAVVALLTGCGGGGDEADLPEFTGGSTTSSSTTSSAASPSSSTGATGGALEGADLVKVETEPPPGEAAAVFTAYVEFWQADAAALTRSDPQWQPLLDRMSGEQAKRTTDLIRGNAAKGQKLTGDLTIRPQVVVTRGLAATVRDCLDLSRTVAVDASGREVPETRGGAAVAYSVAMVNLGGRWVVRDIQTTTDPSCT